MTTDWLIVEVTKTGGKHSTRTLNYSCQHQSIYEQRMLLSMLSDCQPPFNSQYKQLKKTKHRNIIGA